MQPKIHIRYSPGKSGCVAAMFYIESETDVYGWYAQARGRRFHAAFLMIENFYTKRSTVLYRSLEDDVYGPWITDEPPADNPVRCPLPEAVRHELERIQSRFVEEWLFFENDPDAEFELAAYDAMKLTVHALNVKSRRLRRLDRHGPDLEHRNAGSDSNLDDYLEKFWRQADKETTR